VKTLVKKWQGSKIHCQELEGEERALWSALREAVVNDVVKLFPYVIQGFSRSKTLTRFFSCHSAIEHNSLSFRGVVNEGSSTKQHVTGELYNLHTSHRLSEDARESTVSVSFIPISMASISITSRVPSLRL
jgi:hypothetical protein